MLPKLATPFRVASNEFLWEVLISPRKDETLLELFSFLADKSSPSLDLASIVDLKGQV